MSGEEMFVDGYLLHSDDTNSGFELDYLVDEQKRVTMRENLLNGSGIVDCHRQTY